MPSESPSANPSRGCENLRTDCGWGIFNPWTCRCDCPVGICLDSNEQCYLTCVETINHNPFGGCSPGWDCPWFPDPTTGHCKSEMHNTQNNGKVDKNFGLTSLKSDGKTDLHGALGVSANIFRTSKQCCEVHFNTSATCLQESKDSHPPFPWPIHFPGTAEYRNFLPPDERGRSNVWFPDLHNELNCVFGRNYEAWMGDNGFSDFYLFPDPRNCCKKWYPNNSGCPYTGGKPTNPEEDKAPWYSDYYPARGHYYPDFTLNSCGFGQDFPAWMGSSSYEKFYLFAKGGSCCTKYFPSVSNCPYEDESQFKLGYYWEKYQADLPNAVAYPVIYNHLFYPDMKARVCVNGTDYPSWMAEDKTYTQLYLYKNDPRGCCKYWFGETSADSCVHNIIQSTYINTTQIAANVTAAYLDMWYPILEENRCMNDGHAPSWMMNDGYPEWFLFNTRSSCCAAFGC